MPLSYLGNTRPAYSLAFNGSSVDGSELLLILRQAFALSSFALEQGQCLRFVCCSRHVKKRGIYIPLLFGRYVTRTRDPHNVDVMRYQLRQSPIFFGFVSDFRLAGSLRYLPSSFSILNRKAELCQSSITI